MKIGMGGAVTEITEELDQNKKGEKPYSSSWINSFLNWIDSRLVPNWLLFVGIYVLSVLYLALALWAESYDTMAENLDLIFLNAVWIPFPLASMQYMIRYADRVLDRFHPVMECSHGDLERMRYKMKMIPQSVAVVIPLIVGSLIYYDAIWGASIVIGELQSPIAKAIGPLYPVFGFSFIPLLVYLTLRQLHAISGMFARVKEVNIFHLQPLYIPSTLTARTGVIWILYLNANILISGVGGGTNLALVIVVGVVKILLAISAFVVPLWGIHRKIVREKKRTLGENSALIENAYSELKHFLETKDYARMDQLKEGISSLFSYRAALEKAPTWPWQPETFRGFLSAVFLPLVIWIVQRLLAPLF